MYGHVLGASTATVAGAVVLPNTGGNPLLTVAAVVSIAVGCAVLLSVGAHIVLKKAYKA